jgi:RNA polymerase sigma-B factor
LEDKLIKKGKNKRGNINIASIDSLYNFSFSIFSNSKPENFENNQEIKLSNDQILEYIKSYKETNDQDLFLNKIYPLFTKIINKIVNKYKDSCKDIGIEDLIQCGYLGLIKAIENIDISYIELSKINAISFIYSYIEGEIKHYIRDKSDFIKIPRTLKKLYYQIHNLLTKNPNLTISKISEILNLKEESIIEILNLPIKKEIDINRIKSKKSKYFELSVEDKILVEQIFEKLSYFEKQIFNLLFNTDLTKVEISQKLNITRKKLYNIIESIKNKIIQKLS